MQGIYAFTHTHTRKEMRKSLQIPSCHYFSKSSLPDNNQNQYKSVIQNHKFKTIESIFFQFMHPKQYVLIQNFGADINTKHVPNAGLEISMYRQSILLSFISRSRFK